MSGLIKPSTQRHHASRRTRNPAVNPNVYKSGGGGICGSGGKGESLFISSYHEDKRQKYRMQRNAQLKKWITYATLGLVTFVVVSSKRSGSSNDHNKALRSASQLSTSEVNQIVAAGAKKDSALVGKVVQEVAAAAIAAKSNEPKVPYCTLVDTADKNPDPSQEEKPEVNNKICGRKVPINLLEESKKAIPALDPSKTTPVSKEEALLLSKNTMTASFRTIGDSFVSFFHAYDMAHNTNKPLYMTEDSWPVQILFPLFFSPASKEEHDTLWSNVADALGIQVVKDKAALTAKGFKQVDEKNELMELFYTHANVDPAKIRNHRSAILRKLFFRPALGGKVTVCDTINGLLGSGTDRETKKYTVIHIADPGQKKYLPKLNGGTGKDHKAATEMQPEYVKNILKRVDDMMKHDIYTIDSSDKPDDEVHTRLAKDAELKTQLKCLRDKRLEGLGGKMYLAVLADVYLGNPTDHTSMWIARMRYALGMKHTYIFTEKRGDNWVSYMNDDEYLDLYNTAKLGPWMG